MRSRPSVTATLICCLSTGVENKRNEEESALRVILRLPLCSKPSKSVVISLIVVRFNVLESIEIWSSHCGDHSTL
jgi:hypothetical protein